MIVQISITVHLLFIYYHFFFRFFIIVYKEVGTPGHDKDVVDALNDIYKCMLKLAIKKLLNSKLICDDLNFQVHAGSLKWIISGCKCGKII